MEPGSYVWILVIGSIFAFLDAFGIGANDVANSFATSVGSRSLTIGQACLIAIFTEFGGAILLGAETSDTIKNGIIDPKIFSGNPEALMLGFMCALVGSATWVLIASSVGWPVSTTHSIVGAVGGVGLCAFGTSAIQGDSLVQILLSWVISPGLSGAIAACIYLVTKFTVMRHKDSLKRGLFALPFYFMFALGICTFYLINKAPKGINLAKADNSGKWGLVLGITAGVIAAVGAFSFVFIVPYFRRLLVEEEDMKLKHLLNPWAPTQPKSTSLEKKLRFGADAFDDVETPGASQADLPAAAKEERGAVRSFIDRGIVVLTRGVTTDVVTAKDAHVRSVHASATKYDAKTEYLYSFLQICTACFASFAHGSNDVANAAGPLSAIIEIYNTGDIPGKKVPTPIYVLALMGLSLNLGLVLYGYNVMRSLGNNITYQSPSRGFAMELGAALTVITASFLGLPVSTTHCITGATVAVGLCNGDVKAINWRMVSWTLFSWIATLPIAGGIAGGLFKLLTSSPSL